MKEKLTQTLVQKLEPGKSRFFVYDTQLPGLLLRVETSGRKTYYVDYTPSGGKRVTCKVGSSNVLTVAQAREAVKEMLAEVALGGDPRAEKIRDISLDKFISDIYGPWVVENRKSGASTVAMIRTSFHKFLPMHIDEITRYAVEQWRVTTRKQNGTKASSINRKVTALKAAINWGVKRGFLKANPLNGLETLPEHDSKAKVRFLSKEEEERLMAVLDIRDEEKKQERIRYNVWRSSRGMEPLPELPEDHLKTMVIISLNTGLRRNELFSLEWSDVDDGGITVRSSNAKSGKARHVPLNKRARQALEDWSIGKDRNGLVFPSPKTGGRMGHCNSAWEAVLERADIEDFRWHDMRHTFASNLVMAGVDLNTVRELLGHADLKMTLCYAHLAPQVKARAVGMLE